MNATLTPPQTAEHPSENAETLADLRKAVKKTQAQVAAALGLAAPRITQIEQTGTRDIDRLEAFAKLYGVPLARVAAAARRCRK